MTAVVALPIVAVLSWLAIDRWPWRSSPASVAAPLRFVISPPPNVRIEPLDFSISSDGRLLVYMGYAADGPRLFARRLDSFETVTFPASRRSYLAISPDGESVGYLSEGSLYRLPRPA